MKTFYALLLALGICLGFTFPAMAEYPAKPIMLMIGSSRNSPKVSSLSPSS